MIFPTPESSLPIWHGLQWRLLHHGEAGNGPPKSEMVPQYVETLCGNYCNVCGIPLLDNYLSGLVNVMRSLVQVLIYSPDRPLVDIAEVFLWLMAVGTILCASFWSAWSAREAANEHYKTLKGNVFRKVTPGNKHLGSWDDSDALVLEESCGDKSVVDINTASAILFVVIASCFLILIYKFMSEWFLELLVVLFCIGGVEVGIF
eukprot:Gb_32092 [translate_table: standard]